MHVYAACEELVAVLIVLIGGLHLGVAVGVYMPGLGSLQCKGSLGTNKKWLKRQQTHRTFVFTPRWKYQRCHKSECAHYSVVRSWLKKPTTTSAPATFWCAWWNTNYDFQGSGPPHPMGFRGIISGKCRLWCPTRLRKIKRSYPLGTLFNNKAPLHLYGNIATTRQERGTSAQQRRLNPRKDCQSSVKNRHLDLQYIL